MFYFWFTLDGWAVNTIPSDNMFYVTRTYCTKWLDEPFTLSRSLYIWENCLPQTSIVIYFVCYYRTAGERNHSGCDMLLTVWTCGHNFSFICKVGGNLRVFFGNMLAKRLKKIALKPHGKIWERHVHSSTWNHFLNVYAVW